LTQPAPEQSPSLKETHKTSHQIFHDLKEIQTYGGGRLGQGVGRTAAGDMPGRTSWDVFGNSEEVSIGFSNETTYSREHNHKSPVKPAKQRYHPSDQFKTAGKPTSYSFAQITRYGK
jgi:hypothetical protein